MHSFCSSSLITSKKGSDVLLISICLHLLTSKLTEIPYVFELHVYRAPSSFIWEHTYSNHIASHRIASHRIASHRIASHRIASHLASHRIASLLMHRITSRYIRSPNVRTSHHIASHQMTSNQIFILNRLLIT